MTSLDFSDESNDMSDLGVAFFVRTQMLFVCTALFATMRLVVLRCNLLNHVASVCVYFVKTDCMLSNPCPDMRSISS